MGADARFGYSVMGYRISQPAFESRDAGRSTLVRLWETRRGRRKLAQKPEASHWPCCIRMTHNALPRTFVPGTLDLMKVREMQL